MRYRLSWIIPNVGIILWYVSSTGATFGLGGTGGVSSLGVAAWCLLTEWKDCGSAIDSEAAVGGIEPGGRSDIGGWYGAGVGTLGKGTAGVGADETGSWTRGWTCSDADITSRSREAADAAYPTDAGRGCVLGTGADTGPVNLLGCLVGFGGSYRLRGCTTSASTLASDLAPLDSLLGLVCHVSLRPE